MGKMSGCHQLERSVAGIPSLQTQPILSKNFNTQTAQTPTRTPKDKFLFASTLAVHWDLQFDFSAVHLVQNKKCAIPHSPHSFINSICSASIDSVSGNRGIALHLYGTGRLGYISSNSNPDPNRIRWGYSHTTPFQCRRAFYRAGPPSHFHRAAIPASWPREP